jgi:site-specific DNA-cytosine methylase
MFTEQAQVIKRIQPLCFRLEIADNAVNVNQGSDVQQVIDTLTTDYVIYKNIIPVWTYGDPSHRRRLFIVGFSRRLGRLAHDWAFPTPTHTTQNCPTMRAIAQPDDEVPAQHWRYDNPTRLPWTEPTPGKLHKIAQTGEGMGFSTNPNGVYSWDCLANSQTIYNGGGRRPRLDWELRHDNPVGPTRVTTPVETVRIASLPSDYPTITQTHWKQGCMCKTCQEQPNKTVTAFTRECINNGIPVRTSYQIDYSILQHVKAATRQPTANTAHQSKRRRSAMLDTGSNLRLLSTAIEPYLQSSTQSQFNISVANKQSKLCGSQDGTITIDVLNTKHYETIPYKTSTTLPVTTVPETTLSKELFTVDDLYKNGYSILLRHPTYESGIPEIYRPANSTQAEHRLPVRYDWDGPGGFWVDYELCPTQHANTATTVWDRQYTAMQANQITDTAWDTEAVQEIIVGQHQDDRLIRGVKSGLRQRKQKMTAKEFHREHAHLGAQPDCEVCKLTKGTMRRIYSVVDKHREQRPGHTWVMDGVTWDKRALCGSKYMVTLRDKATGVIRILCLYLRSDIAPEIEALISKMRADPAFHNLPYRLFSVIETDHAGEWGRKNRDWVALETRLQFQTIYKPADRKEEAGLAERTCGIVEVAVKASLMEANLPPSWWARAAKQAEWLLERFPLTTQDVSVPIDGDLARPLELLTRGSYSRRQINRELSYYIPIGTPALVHDTHARGSTLGPKSQWGVAVGMYRESVEFWSPHTNATRLSKSFTAYKLRQGMNFAQFLNLPAMPTTRKEAAVPDDFKEHVVIQLPAIKQSEHTPADPPVRALVKAGPLALAKREHGSDAPIMTTRTQLGRELGGSVRVMDSDGVQLTTDPETGSLTRETQPETGRDCEHPVPMHQHTPYTNITTNPTVVITCDRTTQQLWDEAEARASGHLAIITGVNDTLTRVCKKHQLPAEHHHLYKQWLISTQQHPSGRKLRNEDLPHQIRGAKLPPNLSLPYPTGSRWRDLCTPNQINDRSMESINQQLVRLAENDVFNALSAQKYAFRATGTINLNPSGEASQHEQHAYNVETARLTCAARKKKKKRQRIGSTGEPANTRDALERDNALEWIESMDEEMDGLTRMGVLDHGYTLQEIRDLGITAKPVPLGLYHTHKTGQDGSITRLKTRAAVQGHRGNMQKGVHYTDTFASTPAEDTQRILCALTIHLNLKRRSGDIEKAYCWADLPPGQLIALAYPDGYKRTNEKGEELYMVMRKNLYGHPAAARSWEQERNNKLLTRFNKDGWTCKRMEMDPCLFQITNKHNKHAWLLIHTDDVDAAGEDDQILDDIFDTLNNTWSVKPTNPDYMLGISRKLTHREGRVHTIECTMTAFVEGAAQAFQEHLITRTLSTPFPEKVKISKDDTPTEQEVKDAIGSGYQRIVGILLWAARHCYPEIKYAVGQLCSVMAKPSQAALRAAYHTLSYLSQNKHRGIQFSAEGNHLPVAISDASNKPDRSDGKCIGGFVILWMGGPVAYNSKRLGHVGLSSEHNEYMALTSAIKRIVWLRQLLAEIATCQHLVSKPTLVFGDNLQANRICKEHFVSPGNQYIALSYHYNREQMGAGTVAVKWVETKDNIADLFTKPVSRQALDRLLGALTGYSDGKLMQRVLDAVQ